MKRFAFVIVIAAVLGSGGPAAQDLERLFKAAVNTETVDRDCRGAIEQYRKVASGSNRALAAQALLRMGECYERLGDPEAQRVFERLVDEFNDQKDAASHARTKLVPRTAAATRPAGDRLVKSGPDTWGGRVSPDGRYLAYVDYGDMGFKIHDFVTGVTRPGPACDRFAFSPDGKQLACGGSGTSGIRIVQLAGSAQLRVVYSNSDVDLFFVADWSRDGKSIAVVARRHDRTRQIGVLDIEGGTFRVLKTVGWRGPSAVLFSPDGRYLAYDLAASDTDTQGDVFVMAVDGSGEYRAAADASNEAMLAWSGDGRHLLFASDRSGPIGLWAQPILNGRAVSVDPTMIRRDIGTVDALGLTASGTLFVVKDASTVSLQVAPIDLDAGRLTGTPILQVYGSDTPSWSPDGKRLVYSKTLPSGVRALAIHDLESNTVRELRPRLLYMPLPNWSRDGKSVVVWGRDLQGRGVIKLIDAESGEETFITTAYDIQGVQTSADGTRIIYQDDFFSGSSRPGRIIEREIATGVERDLLVQSRTAEPGMLTPDGRLRIAASLDQRGSTSLLISPTGGGALVRVEVPQRLDFYRGWSWTPDGRSLLIGQLPGPDPTDRAPQHLWLVPLDGREPRQFDVDISAWIVMAGIRLSPDGKRIAYFTGQDSREIWALENVEANIR